MSSLTGVSSFLTISVLLGPGVPSRAQLDEHFAKHGAEFGRTSEQDYLRTLIPRSKILTSASKPL